MDLNKWRTVAIAAAGFVFSGTSFAQTDFEDLISDFPGGRFSTFVIQDVIYGRCLTKPDGYETGASEPNVIARPCLQEATVSACVSPPQISIPGIRQPEPECQRPGEFKLDNRVVWQMPAAEFNTQLKAARTTCLTDPEPEAAPAAVANIYKCIDDPGQQWLPFDSSPTARPMSQHFQNVRTNRCLTLGPALENPPGVKSFTGTTVYKVTMETCVAGNLSQRWRVIPANMVDMFIN
ncbi:MAG: hypothetical protein AAGK23_08425 [Pseudomonadota bacterium]